MRCYLEGGTLASPTTIGMAQVMSAMMAEHNLTRSIFTGINSILTAKNFKSLDGVLVSNIPLPWADGQPDDANSDEDCLVLTSAGELADISCESLLPYFCRKENKCGAKDNGDCLSGYEWEPRTGSCYKFHRTATTWCKALATCHAEGGRLAIINNPTESAALKETIPKNKIIGAYDVDYAFIGFKQYYDDEWATINGPLLLPLKCFFLLTGDTLAKAGFEKWSNGEPNNPGTECCGSIYRNGLLNDAQCELEFPFICEFTP
ncbi:lymphocyte antigen 75-like [Cydia pomonella]|uniref:lymphocyte antigen 75-like n=1 Tax=Cydia pomonella TaxID=82600 RepID=UPI002ADE4D60|nr:lymphocyte antigen 75-like [Cydia pomonella]